MCEVEGGSWQWYCEEPQPGTASQAPEVKLGANGSKV